MSLPVAAVSVISAAGGIILIAGILTLIFKICWVKKRRSRSLNSSLRKEEKEQRISAYSFTKTVTEAPYTVLQKELTLHSKPVTFSNKPHGITQRYSEPVLTGNSLKNELDLSRPHSETDVKYSAAHGNIKTQGQSDSVKEALTSCGKTSMFLSFTGGKHLTQLQQNTYRGLDDGIPAWSMDSIEHQPTELNDKTQGTAIRL